MRESEVGVNWEEDTALRTVPFISFAVQINHTPHAPD